MAPDPVLKGLVQRPALLCRRYQRPGVIRVDTHLRKRTGGPKVLWAWPHYWERKSLLPPLRARFLLELRLSRGI